MTKPDPVTPVFRCCHWHAWFQQFAASPPDTVRTSLGALRTEYSLAQHVSICFPSPSLCFRILPRSLSPQDTVRISFGSPPTEYSLAELLPKRFGPADLLEDTATPLLLQRQDNGVSLAAEPDLGSACRCGDGGGACARAAEGGAGCGADAELVRRAADAALMAANQVRHRSKPGAGAAMCESLPVMSLQHWHRLLSSVLTFLGILLKAVIRYVKESRSCLASRWTT